MSETYKLVDINWVKPDPNQPRRTIDEESINEMAQTMKASGVIEPIIVRSNGIIINGQRRWTAAKRAGLKQIPAIVKGDLSDLEVMELQAIEATQDQEVPTLQRYEFWSKLFQKEKDKNPDFSIQQLAAIIGKSERSVIAAFRAVSAPEAMKQIVREGKMGASLLPVVDGHGLSENERVKLFKKIADGNIPTTGTTLQSKLMPLIDTAPKSVRQKLINEPTYSLDDAEAEVSHIKRAEAVKEAAERGEVYQEPPMSFSEFCLKLESKTQDFKRVLDEASRAGVADNMTEWFWKDFVKALDGVISAIKALKDSRGLGRPLGELPALKDASYDHADEQS